MTGVQTCALPIWAGPLSVRLTYAWQFSKKRRVIPYHESSSSDESSLSEFKLIVFFLLLVFFSFFFLILCQSDVSGIQEHLVLSLKRFSQPFARVNSALIHGCVHRSKHSKVSTSFPQRIQPIFAYTHLRQKSLLNDKPSRFGAWSWFLVLYRHVTSIGTPSSPRPKLWRTYIENWYFNRRP